MTAAEFNKLYAGKTVTVKWDGNEYQSRGALPAWTNSYGAAVLDVAFRVSAIPLSECEILHISR